MKERGYRLSCQTKTQLDQYLPYPHSPDALSETVGESIVSMIIEKMIMIIVSLRVPREVCRRHHHRLTGSSYFLFASGPPISALNSSIF
jgi:hypothetical protein